MASAFGHGLVAYTLTKVIDKKATRLLIVLAIISSIIPDADVIGFFMGIAYESPLGHRGFTHSIVFSFLWSLFLSLILGKKNKKLFFVVLFVVTLSHAVLDAMTSGGRGVGFFIPFENSRHFFGFRPILVSPLGVKRFFSEWGMKVILSELLWIGFPCIFLLFLNKFRK
ncbi:MAG: metal-dependent hydrolase [Flavobacteriaceae bacterium]|nr:metal-dependent hydrolase [Flavobacteriaceae bacterium]